MSLGTALHLADLPAGPFRLLGLRYEHCKSEARHRLHGSPLGHLTRRALHASHALGVIISAPSGDLRWRTIDTELREDAELQIDHARAPRGLRASASMRTRLQVMVGMSRWQTMDVVQHAQLTQRESTRDSLLPLSQVQYSSSCGAGLASPYQTEATWRSFGTGKIWLCQTQNWLTRPPATGHVGIVRPVRRPFVIIQQAFR